MKVVTGASLGIAARTSLGDIAVQQDANPDAINFTQPPPKARVKTSRRPCAGLHSASSAGASGCRPCREKDQKKVAMVREEAIAVIVMRSTIEGIPKAAVSADESRSTFLATTKDVFDEAAGALAKEL